MLVLNAEQVRALAPLSQLIESLEGAFRVGCTAPARQTANVPGGTAERLLLAMPAFNSNGAGVVKLATVFPDNRSQGLPSIQAAIVVFTHTGTPTALLDATVLTRLRTGAASALASKYLSQEDSSHLVIIGTGALAPTMAAAHCAVRPIRRVTVWGRRTERAAATAAEIRSLINHDVEIVLTLSIQEAVQSADIVSCATSSANPVLQGKWLKRGAFVDLVGSFSPAKREADDDAILRSRVFVDTFEGAMVEAGDILDPLARGVIHRSHIEGELSDLVCGRVCGRRARDELIVFKSVGAAIEDLTAAQLVVERATNSAAQQSAHKRDISPA